jgi:hypothetical protein
MAALEDLPPDCTEIGSVAISVFTGPEGLGFAYGYDGLTPEAAIGYLVVTTDRLREERKYDWEGEPEYETEGDEEDGD